MIHHNLVMSKEPSLIAFLEWVSQQNDSYKIFLYGVFNGIFLGIFLISGQWIDPESMLQEVTGIFINSFGNESVNIVWSNLVQPVLLIVGVIEICFHLYMIYKFGKIGISIVSMSFVGILLLVTMTHYSMPSETTYVSLALILVSGVIARHYSNVDFDSEGRVIYDPSK